MLLSTLFPPGSGGAKQPEAGGAGPAALKVNSYAKINWSLDLLYRREDGYHELRTVFQTISIYDRLLIGETPGDIEIVCSDPIVPTDHSNLVYKAAAALREAAGIRRGARIEIDKRIPVAAGLGGGSSNAAAALVALAKLWRVELDVQELFRIAAALGSDVPYFLVGGTALGTGRGEEVYPLEEVSCAGLLLVNPGTRVSTADAYGRYSRLTRAGKARIMPFALLAAKASMRCHLRGATISKKPF